MNERVTPESLAAQVYDRGEPITVEQLHALHEDAEAERERAAEYARIKPALDAIREAVKPMQQVVALSDQWRANYGDPPRKSYVVDAQQMHALLATIATLTATAAAPGAAGLNQVHEVNS